VSRGLADELIYNEAQNEVILVKYLSGGSAGVSEPAKALS
jgi:hypothetical protein